MRGKLCKGCNEMVVGRDDKLFCCALCRSNYHNSKNRKRMSVVVATNADLRRNYFILKRLAEKDCSKVPLKALLALNFKPSLFTSFTQESDTNWIYDISYRISADDWVYINVS